MNTSFIEFSINSNEKVIVRVDDILFVRKIVTDEEEWSMVCLKTDDSVIFEVDNKYDDVVNAIMKASDVTKTTITHCKETANVSQESH